MVGAGINGAAAAYSLALGGRSVTVLEQLPIGHARGSSHGASRVFRLSYPEPSWVRSAQEALAAWRTLEAAAGVQLLRITGSVDVGPHARANAEALTACDVEWSTLSDTDAVARCGLRLDPDEFALFQPTAGVLAAARAHAVLLDGAGAHGAEILEERGVVEIAVETDHVRLVTSATELRAAVVVIAAGAWSDGLLRPVGIELDVTPTRETVAYLHLDGADALPVLIMERPGHEGEVGTYALADGPETVKVGVHRSGPVADPDVTTDPEQWVAEWALEWAAARLPSHRARLDRLDTCLYTNTLDESFVVRRHDRIVVASACSGHAFKFAPLTGRDVAALVDEALGG